jgi:hypothetical protein
MSDEPFQAKKAEVLSRIEIQSECEKFGIQFKGAISSTGWVPCLNPYRPEKNPSCGVNVGSGGQRGYFVAFNMNGKKGLSQAVSFWDLARDFHPTLCGLEFRDIFSYYADQVGVTLKKTQKAPTQGHVDFYRQALSQEVLDYLHNQRGLNDDSIARYEIGFAQRRERVAFPVRDHGELVNIRFHAWKKNIKPKSQNWSGYGQKRLWNVDRLRELAIGETACLTIGEYDSMLIEQETGLVSVSPTNGDLAFEVEWALEFTGKHVVLVCDCDAACREAVASRILPAFKAPVRQGKVLSLRVVWLFDDPKDKDRKDFTDFITKAGGSGQDLLAMIAAADPMTFPEPSDALPAPIVLDSFERIDDKEVVGRRVTVPLYIHGENSEAYHAPTQLLVGECPGKKKGCHGRDDWAWSCDDFIPVGAGNRVQLSCVAANDFQMKGLLREYVCDKGQRATILLSDNDRVTIREVFAHQVLAGLSASVTELVEKTVYTIGSKIYPIGQYKATGFVHSHPRNQKPTMLIDTMEAQEEDWQSFRLDKSRHHLEALQALDVGTMLDDMMYHVTKIYERHDLNLGVLLTLCSPLWIDFPGDGRIRGWVSTVVIGDSGTGKTEISEKTFNHAGVGNRVSGMTSSRTGITYACEYDERRGWRIKAGALLKMSRQALIVDEAQDLEEADLKTMAESLDRGRLKIDRIQMKEFEAMTRCFFTCNPKNPKRASDQRTMSSYRFGCQAVSDIFPKMMLRRLDLVLYAASYDIADKDLVFNSTPPPGLQHVVTPERLRALVHYAWNLRPEQVVVTPAIGALIRQHASRLSNKFGYCEDLPIVYPEDFRKTLCRLCVAYAVLDLASSDGFDTIVVSEEHVWMVYNWLDDIYSRANCQLDQWSEQYKHHHILTDNETLFQMVRNHADAVPQRKTRINTIVNELMKLDPDNSRHKVPQGYFKDILDIDRSTLFRDLKPLINEHLISSSRGYLPTPKLFQFVHWVKKTHPDFFEFDN